MPGSYLRKYNVATSAGTAGSSPLRVAIRKAGSADFAASGDYTVATGDFQVSKDGGAFANIASNPTYTNGLWEIALSATELSCKVLNIRLVDSATKAVDDDAWDVETFGNASANYPAVYSAGTAGNPFTVTDYTTPPTAAANATAVRTELTTELGRLDVAVSTRGTSTYAGADTAGTTTLLSRLTGSRATYLDNLSGGAVALASGVNLTSINGTPTAVDTGTAGVVSFVSGAYVATAGGTVDANVVQVAGEGVVSNGAGKLGVTLNATDIVGFVPADVGLVGGSSDYISGGRFVVGLDAAERVKLHAAQPDYAPAKAGDAMALTGGERTTLAGVVWASLTSGMTTAGSVGKKLADWVVGNVLLWKGATPNDLAAGKVDANASVSLTPQDVQDIADGVAAALGGTGTGDTPVTAATLDDDGDDMTVVDGNGDGIAGVRVLAYVTGETTPEAETTTLQDGTWAAPLMLSSGVAYTVRFYKAGLVQSETTLTL